MQNLKKKWQDMDEILVIFLLSDNKVHFYTFNYLHTALTC